MNFELLSLAIKWVRIRQGITRYRVAKDIGVQWRTFNKIEKSSRNCRVETLMLILLKLKMEIAPPAVKWQGVEFSLDDKYLYHGEEKIRRTELSG